MIRHHRFSSREQEVVRSCHLRSDTCVDCVSDPDVTFDTDIFIYRTKKDRSKKKGIAVLRIKRDQIVKDQKNVVI